MDQAQLLKDQTGKAILPGELVCITCKKKIISSQDNHVYSPQPAPEIEMDFSQPTSHIADSLNASFSQLDCSPIKRHEMKRNSRVSYGKRKLKEMGNKVSESVATVLDVPQEELLESKKHCPETCKACDDLHDLVSNLKDKISCSSDKEKLRLLTLAPQSWSINTIVQEFGVTHYLAKKSRNLKKSEGILPDLQRKLGHGLSEEHIRHVKEFYQDDEFSRQCPGKKDCVIVRNNHGKMHIQKRMLLVNLRELYLEFKKRHSDIKIGFSKFCTLRPPWCVTVDSPGMHSVCVCVKHIRI